MPVIISGITSAAACGVYIDKTTKQTAATEPGYFFGGAGKTGT